MDELFRCLEARIQTLIQKQENLKQANRKLKKNTLLWAREKELLLTKHKATITQIEHMVSRLKSIEKSK